MPRLPQRPRPGAHAGAAQAGGGRFQLGIEGRVLADHAPRHGVGHAADRTSLQPTGNGDAHIRRMADAGIHRAQRTQEAAILPGRQRGHAAGAPVGGDGDGDAGAGMLSVSRQRVPAVRIGQGVDLVEHGAVGDLACVVVVQRVRDMHRLNGVDQRAAAHRLDAERQGGAGAGDPVDRHRAVGVGGGDDAVGARDARRERERGAARMSRIRLVLGEVADRHGDRHRQLRPHPLHGLRGAVGAVVQQQHDVVAPVAPAASLGGERAQACPDPRLLVAGRYGHDEP